MNNRTLRLGVIGAGAMGVGHAEAAEAIEGAEVAAVAETDPGRRESFVSRFRCAGYTAYEEMLEKESLEAVVVGLPNLFHCQATVKAAQAGCHVLVEKPMAMSVDECDQMISAARGNAVKLMVGHTYHFNPFYLKAKEIIDAGELGAVLMAWDCRLGPRLSYRQGPPDWYFHRSQGGGMMMMNGVHFIGRLRWLVGSPVVAVKAMVKNVVQHIPGDDIGLLLLHFANGAYATIHMVGLPGSVRRHETELVCERGMVRILPELWVSREGSYEKVPVAEYPPLTRQLEVFVEAVRKDRQPPVAGEMGRAIMAIALAAEKSSLTGKEVLLEGQG